MIRKKILSFLLILSFITPFFYLPSNAPRAQALFGVGDINLESIPTILELVLKSVGQTIAQKMIDDMVKSTVQWAQTGFEGNPAYVTNPEQYFSDIADGVAGEFIEGSELGFLCSPFQAQIRLSLAQQYIAPTTFQCTLTDIGGNLEAFYSDFSQGGWDTWFSMTQNSSNNPYGAFLDAKIELDSRIARAVGLENQKLDWNQGFLSWSECTEYEKVITNTVNPNATGFFDQHNIQESNGKCITRGPVQTPGSTIKAQLDEVLPSGLEKLITAQHVDQLVSAFASGLLQRYVFGSKGIFAKNTSGGSEREIIDIDGDKIPDGWDYDANGQLDICHHGTVNSSEPPSNTNCLGSNSVSSSPFFVPMCEDLAGAIKELEKYKEFIDRNTFDEVYSNTWMNRSLPVSGAVERLANTISRYEVMEYDVALFALGKYTKELDKRIESLAKDGDLHVIDFLIFNEGAGNAQSKLQKNTSAILEYLKKFQAAVGRCDNPNTAAIGAVTPPDLGGDEGGGQCLVSGERYEEALETAMDTVLSENPDIAALPNIEEGGRQNARTFLSLVESELISMGYNATDDVLNGNNNPNTGDLIAVWRAGDATMERYDAILGGAPTIESAATSQFTGFIPLNCTASGGGTNCGCASGEGGAGGSFPNQPASLESDVEVERKKYAASFASLCTNPSGLEPESCPLGKILNAVAWKNRSSGWTLLGKDSGHRCTIPSGETVACDILLHQPTIYGYDVFRDAEGDAEPIWDLDTSIPSIRTRVSEGSRSIVAPVAP